MWPERARSLWGLAPSAQPLDGWMCSHGCVWRQVSFLRHCPPFCFVFLRQVAQAALEPVCLCIPSSGTASVCHCTILLYGLRYSFGPSASLASVCQLSCPPPFPCAKNEDGVENKQGDISNLLISRQSKIPASFSGRCQFCWTCPRPALVMPS